MCLSVPGKIIKIEKDSAVVDYELEKRQGKILENKYKVGDYVIIQGGFIVQKVPKKQALSSLELYKQTQK